MRQAALEATHEAMSDVEIAQRIAAGDEAALCVLMRRHNQSLYRTARSILKDEAEAEDAVQESYLLAFRSMKKFRGDAKLSTWLIRIVVNESLARLQKRARRAEVIRLDGSSDVDAQHSEINMDEIVSDYQNAPEQPDAIAARAQARRLIEAKIDELPDAFRTVFVLRAVEEMSVEETATSLGIPEATVRTRFFRARGMLREALSREFDVAFAGAFSFAGARCDRIVAGVLTRLKKIQAGNA